MKKYPIFLLLPLLFGAFCLSARGAEPEHTVLLKPGSHLCLVDGVLRSIDPADPGVKPRVQMVEDGGVTLLPIRPVLEAFGGQAEWLPPDGVSCTLGDRRVELCLGQSFATVSGRQVELDVPASAENGRTYLPLRFVVENLGLKVGWDGGTGSVVLADGDLPQPLSALPQLAVFEEKLAAVKSPVELLTQSYSLPSGTVAAKVVTVDLNDPRVKVRAALPDGKLNHTRSFADICAGSGAQVIVNANFFNSGSQIKDPVGHLMIDGEMVYGSSGRSTLGITEDNRALMGRPGLFYRIAAVDGGSHMEWSAFEVNVLKQFANQAVLYTPARGTSYPVTYPGFAMEVREGRISGYRAVSPGEEVAIPADGYSVWFSQETASTDWHLTPELGRAVTVEPYLFTDNGEPFSVEGLATMVNGAPRLVRSGQIETFEEPEVKSDSGRFGYGSTPRTAVGITSGNTLVLVSTPSATLNAMRELMLTLGCQEALNLDGGGSTALYYQGEILAAPGRELTGTLQVFVEP